MSGQAFAQLMALSRSNTDKKQDAVQQALQERKRREEAKRRENEENERKEKQRAEAERKRYFEKQKQEAEMEKRRAEQEKVAEAARQRRKDEQRDSLLYGPKKAKSLHSTSTAPSSSYPKSSSGVREEVSAKRAPTEKSGALALTREELRERKQQAEQRKMLGFSAPKRPSGMSGGTHRAGRRLPGGAMDMMAGPQASDSSKEYRSVRERLAAQPNMLTKLNVVKRDVRSIDEIMRDRENAKAAKTLNGDDAKGFDGWFDTKKKPQAPAPTPKSTSEWSTPVSGRAAPPPKPKPSAKPPVPAPAPKKSTAAPSKPAPKTSTTSVSSSQRPGATKKRSRSPTYSDERPSKRRPAAHGGDDGGEDVSSMIWQMFGKNRAEYMARDINSDDEDMEADARAVEYEENASARVARREDELEREAERRHDAEKARRRAAGR